MANNKKTNKSHTGAPKVRKKDAPMTKKQKIFTLVAAILIVAIVATATVFIVRAIRGVTIDLMRDNLSRYVTISRDDYGNMTVDIPLDTYDDEDLERRINEILVENKSKDPLYDGGAYKSEAITLGDVVSLMYRGYYVDENGKTVEISSNFSDDDKMMIEVGSCKIIDDSQTPAYFIPGFTDGMIGIIPSDYAPFAKYNDGTVEEGDVIYLTYTAFYPDSAGTYKQVSAERIDLGEDIDATYGTGFKAFLLGTAEGTEAQKIGTALSSKTFPYGEGSAGYSDMKIEYVTRGCERAPLTVDVTFPANYSEKTLRGVAAKFDLYIANAIIYDTPVLDEKLITETLKLTADDLKDFEGADIVAKYKDYLKTVIEEEIEQSNKDMIIEAVDEILLGAAKIEKLPEGNVDDYYDNYYQEIAYHYSLYSSYFNSIDAAALNYLSLPQGTDWRKHIRTMAEDAMTEELIFYYIIREEGFVPSKSEFKSMREEIIESHYAYHLELNADELSKLKGEKYDARVAEIKEEMLEYYGDDYFDETVYYNYGMDKILAELVTVK